MTGQMTRRTHKKSRAGCITCKARRIKCTEERPACARCIKSGRFCEGYIVDSKHGESQSETSESFQSPAYPVFCTISPDFRGEMSPLELRSLQFFHDRTVPALAGFFESNLWQRLLLQISVTEPGLRHAMIAVGFLQKLSELYGLPALDFDNGPVARLNKYDDFAVNQYMKAVTLIRKRLSSGDPDSIITLVACILFVCLEFLRGERKAAYAHLKSGVEIIKSRMEHQRKTNSPDAMVPFHTEKLNETDLAPMFARLSFFSTLHRQPKDDPFMAMLDLDSKMWSETQAFESLEQARMVCINQMNATLRFCWIVIAKQFSGQEAVEAGRAKIEGRLEGWSRAFEPFLSMAMFKTPSKYTSDLRGPAILRVQHILAVIWAKVVRCPQNERSYDSMLDNFISIIEACESIINLTIDSQSTRDTQPSMFSLDHGIIPPLFFAAVKCRDPSTRRKAISLLNRAPRREGVWDARTAAKLAEMHVSIEEELVPQPSNQDWPPLHSRIIDCETCMRNPENPHRRLVIFRMVRRNGQEEPGRREQYLYYQEVGIQSIPYSDRSMKKVVHKDPVSTFDSPKSVHQSVDNT